MTLLARSLLRCRPRILIQSVSVTYISDGPHYHLPTNLLGAIVPVGLWLAMQYSTLPVLAIRFASSHGFDS